MNARDLIKALLEVIHLDKLVLISMADDVWANIASIEFKDGVVLIKGKDETR